MVSESKATIHNATLLHVVHQVVTRSYCILVATLLHSIACYSVAHIIRIRIIRIPGSFNLVQPGDDLMNKL